VTRRRKDKVAENADLAHTALISTKPSAGMQVRRKKKRKKKSAESKTLSDENTQNQFEKSVKTGIERKQDNDPRSKRNRR